MKYLFVALLLAGCTTYFEHPTKSLAEIEQDIYECERDAAPAQNPARADALIRRCMAVRGHRVKGFFE
jgi:hypothetical protein